MVQHILSIAGFSDIIGVVSVALSIVVVGIMLQRMKGPGNREPQI
jgi:hypothetical protein